jgi:hypothetical protein
LSDDAPSASSGGPPLLWMEGSAVAVLSRTASLATELAKATDIGAAAELLVVEVMETLQARRATVIISDQVIVDHERTTPDKTVSLNSGDLSSRRLPLPLLHQVVASRSIISRTLDTAQTLIGDYPVPDDVSDIICLPLIAQGELVSALYVELRSSSSVPTREARDFLVLIGGQSAGFLGALRTTALLADLETAHAKLRNAFQVSLKTTALLARLGRGGTWSWEPKTGAMAISRELGTALGFAAVNMQCTQTIWDLTVADEPTIPSDVTSAVNKRSGFEVDLRIMRPGDEVITTLFVVGEPVSPDGAQYEGIALDVGSLVEQRDRSTLETALLELLQNLADPITAIMLDMAAATRWLHKRDTTEARSAIDHAEHQALRIPEMFKQALSKTMAAEEALDP